MDKCRGQKETEKNLFYGWTQRSALPPKTNIRIGGVFMILIWGYDEKNNMKTLFLQKFLI